MNEIQPLSEEAIGQDWSGLSLGEPVTVAEAVGEPYRAVVDALTPDHRVVWVVAEATRLRKAFDYREGVTLTPIRPHSNPGVMQSGSWRHVVLPWQALAVRAGAMLRAHYVPSGAQ